MKKLSFFFLTFSFFLSSYPAWGAVAEDASTTAVATAVSTIGLSHTASGADRYLLASVFLGRATNPSATVTDCNFNGDAMTAVDTATDIPGFGHISLWKLANPDTGSPYTLTCNFSAMVDYIVLGVSSFTGASAIGTAVKTEGGSYVSSSVDVTGASNGLVVDFLLIEADNEAATPDGFQTQMYTDYSSPYVTAYASKRAGTGTLTMSWTWTTGAYSAQIGVLISPTVAPPLTGRKRVVVIQ